MIARISRFVSGVSATPSSRRVLSCFDISPSSSCVAGARFSTVSRSCWTVAPLCVKCVSRALIACILVFGSCYLPFGMRKPPSMVISRPSLAHRMPGRVSMFVPHTRPTRHVIGSILVTDTDRGVIRERDAIRPPTLVKVISILPTRESAAEAAETRLTMTDRQAIADFYFFSFSILHSTPCHISSRKPSSKSSSGVCVKIVI